MKTPEIKQHNVPKAYEAKNRRRSFVNVSGRSNFSGRRSTKYDRSRVTRNVHANIDFSELDEVCLDVGKVDLSHAARISNDLSPYKCSRETAGDHDVSFKESVNGHARNESFYYKKYGDHLKHMISCYVQLGMLPSKLLTSRSPLRYPLKKNEDEDWKGWDSKISFLSQQGCPVVSVQGGTCASHVLVTTEDLVDRECQILEKCNGFSCYRNNFEKHVLGENDGRGIKSVSERSNELKNKLCQYFSDTGELDVFLESIDCSIALLKKKTNRQLDFSEGSNGHHCAPSVGRRLSKQRKLLSGAAEAGFTGFTNSDIVQSQKIARKVSDLYTKLKNSHKSVN